MAKSLKSREQPIVALEPEILEYVVSIVVPADIAEVDREAMRIRILERIQAKSNDAERGSNE